MPSEQATVDEIVATMSGAGAIRSRKMFGEHAIYCDDRLVALVCDDQLFVKMTDAGRALLNDEPVTGPPYPGARPHFIIAEADRENPALMTGLIAVTARDVPPPRAKRPAKRRPQ